MHYAGAMAYGFYAVAGKTLYTIIYAMCMNINMEKTFS
jgi:hypothetical protein